MTTLQLLPHIIDAVAYVQCKMQDDRCLVYNSMLQEAKSRHPPNSFLCACSGGGTLSQPAAQQWWQMQTTFHGPLLPTVSGCCIKFVAQQISIFAYMQWWLTIQLQPSHRS